MAKASIYIGREHCTEKTYNGRGDTAHTFLIGGTLGGREKLKGGNTVHTMLIAATINSTYRLTQ